MKKLLALVLTMMMVLSLAACGSTGGGNDGGPKITKVDLSKYPADLNDWSAQDLLDYFKEAVDLPGDWEEWYRDVDWWVSYPVHNSSGGWNDDGSVQFELYTFDPDAPDTTPEAVEEWLEVFRTDPTHTNPDLNTASHLVGNVMFCYEFTTDEEYYSAFEAAYEQLVSAFGVTPDF